MTDDDIYKAIARELNFKSIDQGAWTRCFAEAAGDEGRAKSLYIRHRFAQLRASADAASPLVARLPAGAPASEIEQLRFEIDAELVRKRQATCYAALGLRATASDAEIGAAINGLGERPTLHADVQYAVETLADPYARERYDRALLARLRTEDRAATAAVVTDRAAVSIWSSRKMSFLIGVAALIAFAVLAQGWLRARAVGDSVDAAVALRRESMQTSAMSEARRLEMQRESTAQVVQAAEERRQAREAAELRARLDRDAREARRAEAERSRQERAQRSQQQAEERARLSQQQAEERAAERQRRYYACVAADRSGNAAARCAGYR